MQPVLAFSITDVLLHNTFRHAELRPPSTRPICTQLDVRRERNTSRKRNAACTRLPLPSCRYRGLKPDSKLGLMKYCIHQSFCAQNTIRFVGLFTGSSDVVFYAHAL